MLPQRLRWPTSLALVLMLSAGCGDDDGTPMEMPDAGERADAQEVSNNTPPSFVDLTGFTAAEDTTSLGLFEITDAETDAQLLTVTATSGDQALLASDKIVLVPNPDRWLISVSPEPDASGVVTVTLTVSDGELSATGTIDIDIQPINDPPTFDGGPNPTTLVGGPEVTLVGWASNISPGPFESDQLLWFEVTTANPLLFATLPALSPEGTLTFTPTGRIGTSSVTVVAKDDHGGASAPFQFVITVDCTASQPAGDFFAGAYTMDQLSGTDPFYGAETFGDNKSVTLAADGNNRDFDFVYFPGIFNSDYHFHMSLCGGSIYVQGRINAGGLGCGGANIGFTNAVPPSTYGVTDDVIDVAIADFAPDGNCNKGSYPVLLRFTKVVP